MAGLGHEKMCMTGLRTIELPCPGGWRVSWCVSPWGAPDPAACLEEQIP
jgi:hypothetical protein